MRIPQVALVPLLITAATQLSAGQAEKPLLLREPSMSRTQTAFVYAGDIWIVSWDGGFTGVPNLAFYTLDGKWDVENHGVPPDYDVEMDPKAVREGHDPQLEKAVEVAMELLKKNPTPTFSRPPYPKYHKRSTP